MRHPGDRVSALDVAWWALWCAVETLIGLTVLGLIVVLVWWSRLWTLL